MTVAVLPYTSSVNPSHISYSCASHRALAHGPQEAVSLIGMKTLYLDDSGKETTENIVLLHRTKKMNSTNANTKASTTPQMSQFLKQQLRSLQSMQT